MASLVLLLDTINFGLFLTSDVATHEEVLSPELLIVSVLTFPSLLSFVFSLDRRWWMVSSYIYRVMLGSPFEPDGWGIRAGILLALSEREVVWSNWKCGRSVA